MAELLQKAPSIENCTLQILIMCLRLPQGQAPQGEDTLVPARVVAQVVLDDLARVRKLPRPQACQGHSLPC